MDLFIKINYIRVDITDFFKSENKKTRLLDVGVYTPHSIALFINECGTPKTVNGYNKDDKMVFQYPVYWKSQFPPDFVSAIEGIAIDAQNDLHERLGFIKLELNNE